MRVIRRVLRASLAAILLVSQLAACGYRLGPVPTAQRVTEVTQPCTTGCTITPPPSPAPSNSCQTQMNCQNVGCNGNVGSNVCGTNDGCLGMDDGEECMSPGQCDVVTGECNEPGNVACTNPFGCALNDFNPNGSGQSTFHRTSPHYLYHSYIYFDVAHFWSQHFACNFSSSQSNVLDPIANDINTKQVPFLQQSNSAWIATTTGTFSYTDQKAGTVNIRYSASTGILFGGDSLVTTAYPMGPNIKKTC